jgi:hypothetical protein
MAMIPQDSTPTAEQVLDGDGSTGVFRFSDEADTALINEVSVRSEPLQGPDVFHRHALQREHPNAIPAPAGTSDWVTITLLTLLILFTWFRHFFNKIFRQLIAASFNPNTANQIVRDESVLLQRASLILSVISYLLMGLFLHQLSVMYSWKLPLFQSGIVRFALFSIVVALAYSLKMLLLRFLSAVFDQDKAAAQYIFGIFLTVMLCGIVLLPANILLAYAQPALREYTVWIAAGALALLFVWRLVRAVVIWMESIGFTPVYLFLYLCAFEITPLLVIWKLAA